MALDQKLKAILEEARGGNDSKDDESKYQNPYTRSSPKKRKNLDVK